MHSTYVITCLAVFVSGIAAIPVCKIYREATNRRDGDQSLTNQHYTHSVPLGTLALSLLGGRSPRDLDPKGSQAVPYPGSDTYLGMGHDSHDDHSFPATPLTPAYKTPEEADLASVLETVSQAINMGTGHGSHWFPATPLTPAYKTPEEAERASELRAASLGSDNGGA